VEWVGVDVPELKNPGRCPREAGVADEERLAHWVNMRIACERLKTRQTGERGITDFLKQNRG